MVEGVVVVKGEVHFLEFRLTEDSLEEAGGFGRCESARNRIKMNECWVLVTKYKRCMKETSPPPHPSPLLPPLLLLAQEPVDHVGIRSAGRVVSVGGGGDDGSSEVGAGQNGLALGDDADQIQAQKILQRA